MKRARTGRKPLHQGRRDKPDGKWLDKNRLATKELEDVEEMGKARIAMAAPLFAPTIEDGIRALNFQDDLEDEILYLLKLTPTMMKRKDSPLRLGFFQPTNTGKRQIVELRLSAENLIVKSHNLEAEVAQTIIKAVGPDRTRDGNKVVLPVRGPESRLTLAVLKTIGLYLGTGRRV